MGEKQKKNVLALILAILAIAGGVMAFSMGLIEGRRAGSETMMIYASPTVILAVIAIAVQRNVVTYLGVGGGILAIVGVVLGS